MRNIILGDRSLRRVELLRSLLAGLTCIWMNTANRPARELHSLWDGNWNCCLLSSGERLTAGEEPFPLYQDEKHRQKF